MRISVLIPSRGRTRQLGAALTSLQMCQSGEHLVQYVVAVDDDDLPTRDFVQETSKEIALAMRFGPRPESLGSVANDLAVHWPADAYAVWADDLLCIGYGWDAKIAAAAAAVPHGVFWWRTAREELSLVPVVTEKWRAAAGRIFTEHFPFWYDDCWLHELWLMTTDSDPIMLDMTMVDKPTETLRMRDLAFWNGFFHATRAQRIADGKAMAARLGLPEPKMGDAVADLLEKHKLQAAHEIADIERRNKANRGEPTPEYLRAKARAEEWMAKAA